MGELLVMFSVILLDKFLMKLSKKFSVEIIEESMEFHKVCLTEIIKVHISEVFF